MNDERSLQELEAGWKKRCLNGIRTDERVCIN